MRHLLLMKLLISLISLRQYVPMQVGPTGSIIMIMINITFCEQALLIQLVPTAMVSLCSGLTAEIKSGSTKSFLVK